jgi:hypothetical protein
VRRKPMLIWINLSSIILIPFFPVN